MNNPFVINRDIIQAAGSQVLTMQVKTNTPTLMVNNRKNIERLIRDFCQDYLDWDPDYPNRTRTQPLSIGGEHNWSFYFLGQIDDRIWDPEMGEQEYYGRLDNVNDEGYQNMIDSVFSFLTALRTCNPDSVLKILAGFDNDDTFSSPESIAIQTLVVEE